MICRITASLLLIVPLLPAQRRVDPRHTYVRVIAVVPHVGQGTAADPKRPQYAPLPRTAPNQPESGIIGFMQQVSDDGRFTIVEYVARDLAALQSILNDKSITAFVKGKDKKGDIEVALKRFKKDFDLEKFGLVMP